MGNNISLCFGEDDFFPLLGEKGYMGKPKYGNDFEMMEQGMW